jgi:hypothetical protein
MPPWTSRLTRFSLKWLVGNGLQVMGYCRMTAFRDLRIRQETKASAVDILPVNEEYRMDTLIEKLNNKLSEWQPRIAQEVRESIAEMIEWADHDSLDIMRSRAVEQEVMDILDVS